MGRLKWWWIRHFKIKDCKHCCLWCEYYKSCSTDWAEPIKKEKNKAAAEMVKNLHAEHITLNNAKVIEKHTYGRITITEEAKAFLNTENVIEKIKAEIEKQIERDYAYSKNESCLVKIHEGTANGLQVAIRIIDGVAAELRGEK